MGEIVPNELKKRNDFVTKTEMRECCNFVGEILATDLKAFFDYYVINVQRCKFT